MTPANTTFHDQVFYRITALWVICEAFAGGIMHGIKLPFTGLIISSLAITCIILIAWHVPFKGAILKATIIVAVCKLMLSPHSPPTAYIAVFFQGLMGQLFLKNRQYFTAAAIIVSVLSLVESAVQRILVLIIVYGNGFWKAVDQYIHKLTGENSISNYSVLIAVSYIAIHALIGIFTGMYASRLARRSAEWRTLFPQLIIHDKFTETTTPIKQKKKFRIKWILAACWVALLLAYLHAWIFPSQSVLPANEVAGILLRSLLIVLSWILIVSPLLMKLLQSILKEKEARNKASIQAVMHLLPQTKYIFSRSWQLSSSETGFERIKLFTKALLINTI